MSLHPNFPESPHDILAPEVRWTPAVGERGEQKFDKSLPPLVHKLQQAVKAWRDEDYRGATPTSRSLLNWWFKREHPLPTEAEDAAPFCYYFAQREAVETVIYLYDVVGVQDKFDLMRFDASGKVSGGMFPEKWRRFVIKMATGSGKTKVMSLLLAWSYFHKCYEKHSALARNFLIIAPNIIVLESAL